MALHISKSPSIAHEYYPIYSSENGDNETLCPKINVSEGVDKISLDNFDNRGCDLKTLESIIEHLRTAVAVAKINTRVKETRIEYLYPLEPLDIYIK